MSIEHLLSTQKMSCQFFTSPLLLSFNNVDKRLLYAREMSTYQLLFDLKSRPHAYFSPSGNVDQTPIIQSQDVDLARIPPLIDDREISSYLGEMSHNYTLVCRLL